MIQRIQSIWLLLVVASSVLTFFLPFAYAAESNNLVELTAQSYWYTIVLTVLAGLGGLIAIFLYHDRKLQIRICSYTLIVSLGLLATYIVKTLDYPKMGPSLFCVLVGAIPILLVMSIRAIRNDMKLVEESDRLR